MWADVSEDPHIKIVSYPSWNPDSKTDGKKDGQLVLWREKHCVHFELQQKRWDEREEGVS